MKKQEQKTAAPNNGSSIGIGEGALIGVLFTALIVLFIGYCLLKTSPSRSDLPPLTENEERLLFGSHNGDADSGRPLLTPAFIGLIREEKRQGYVPVSSEAREGLATELRLLLESLIVENGEGLSFADEQEAQAYREALYDNTNCLYAAFDGDIPASILLPAMDSSVTDGSAASCLVHEIIIAEDDEGELTASMIASDGSITLFRSASHRAFSAEELSSYADRQDMASFTFVSASEDDGSIRSYPVFTSSVAFADVGAYTDKGHFLIEGSEDLTSVLKAFTFNPNSNNFYRTRGSAVTYVENHGELRVSADGGLSYTAFSDGGGIPLSAFTGVSSEDGGFSDRLTASAAILRALDPEHYGGEASPELIAVTFSGGRVIFRFAYRLGGITVDDLRDAAVLTFDGSYLIAASVRPAYLVTLPSSAPTVPASLLFSLERQKENRLPEDVQTVYRPISLSEEDTEKGIERRYAASTAFLYPQE